MSATSRWNPQGKSVLLIFNILSSGKLPCILPRVGEGYPQTPRYEWWRWHGAYGNEDARRSNVVAVVTLKL
jgi:hypothetical protein